MRLWWAASFSVQEARIKRANFMTRVCSLWKASAVYDRTRDDRSHCRRAAAYRQSKRRSLNVVGLQDDAAILPARSPALEGGTSPCYPTRCKEKGSKRTFNTPPVCPRSRFRSPAVISMGSDTYRVVARPWPGGKKR